MPLSLVATLGYTIIGEPTHTLPSPISTSISTTVFVGAGVPMAVVMVGNPVPELHSHVEGDGFSPAIAAPSTGSITVFSESMPVHRVGDSRTNIPTPGAPKVCVSVTAVLGDPTHNVFCGD